MAACILLLLLACGATGLKPSPAAVRGAMREMCRKMDLSTDAALLPPEDLPTPPTSRRPTSGQESLRAQLEAATQKYERRGRNGQSSINKPAPPSTETSDSKLSPPERAANWLVSQFELLTR